MSFVNMLAQWGNGDYTGAMLALDNLVPPLFLGFPFAPEMYSDDFSAEFNWHSLPGSRHQYPIYKGGSPRTISFQLKFDADYPVTSPDGKARELTKDNGGENRGKNFGSQVLYSTEVAIAIAILEKFKLPKQGPAQVVAQFLNGFMKIRPGDTDPAPPLLLFAPSMTKFYLGFLAQSKINQIRFNSYMMCTRATADCTFFVSPDLIFTTLEDALREVYAVLGWFY